MVFEMGKTLLKNARIINEGKQFDGDILIEDERIIKIGTSLSSETANSYRCTGQLCNARNDRRSGTF